MKLYTLHEAIEELKPLKVSYRNLRYYVPHYPNDVVRNGRSISVTDKFIEKVRKNKEQSKKVISEPRTKEQLLAEIKDLKSQIKESGSVNMPETEEGLIELIGNAIEKLSVGKNESTFRMGDNVVEIFDPETYNNLSSQLQEAASLSKEIEKMEVHFEEIKASKDEIIEHYKGQFEYQRQLADKQLEQMDKLLDYLKERNTREGERARIEAVEKRVIPREYNDPYNSGQR